MVFSWCLEAPGRQMCTFEVLGLWCEAPGGPEAARVSHDNPRAQTCTFEGPGLHKNHHNSSQKTPRERQKEQKWGGREKKKSEILGGPAEGGPEEGGRAEGGPAEGGLLSVEC